MASCILFCIRTFVIERPPWDIYNAGILIELIELSVYIINPFTVTWKVCIGFIHMIKNKRSIGRGPLRVSLSKTSPRPYLASGDGFCGLLRLRLFGRADSSLAVHTEQLLAIGIGLVGDDLHESGFRDIVLHQIFDGDSELLSLCIEILLVRGTRISRHLARQFQRLFRDLHLFIGANNVALLVLHDFDREICFVLGFCVVLLFHIVSIYYRNFSFTATEISGISIAVRDFSSDISYSRGTSHSGNYYFSPVVFCFNVIYNDLENLFCISFNMNTSLFDHFSLDFPHFFLLIPYFSTRFRHYSLTTAHTILIQLTFIARSIVIEIDVWTPTLCQHLLSSYLVSN